MGSRWPAPSAPVGKRFGLRLCLVASLAQDLEVVVVVGPAVGDVGDVVDLVAVISAPLAGVVVALADALGLGP